MESLWHLGEPRTTVPPCSGATQLESRDSIGLKPRSASPSSLTAVISSDFALFSMLWTLKTGEMRVFGTRNSWRPSCCWKPWGKPSLLSTRRCTRSPFPKGSSICLTCFFAQEID